MAAQDVTFTTPATLPASDQAIDHVAHIHEIVGAFHIEHRAGFAGAANDFTHLRAAEIVRPDHAGWADDNRIQTPGGGLLNLHAGGSFRTIIFAVRVVLVVPERFVHDHTVWCTCNGVDGTGIDQPADAGMAGGFQHVTSPFHVD